MGCGSSKSLDIPTDVVLTKSTDKILQLNIIEAENLRSVGLDKIDPFCIVSFGTRSFKTLFMKNTQSPIWNQHLAFVVTEKEANYGLAFSVHDKDILDPSDFIGKGIIESIQLYSNDKLNDIWIDLTAVKDGVKQDAGRLHISLQIHTKEDIELNFWKHMLQEFDTDKNGGLEKDQLGFLLEGIGMYVSDKDLDEKFKKADLNQDQTITADELHKFFHDDTLKIAESRAHPDSSRKSEKEAEAIWDIVKIAEEIPSSENDPFVIGGFLTESYAVRGFGERLLNRILLGEYKMNEDNGNIFVQDRKTGQLIEEKMPGFVRMGIRALYQINLNLDSLKVLLKILKAMSYKQGKAYNRPDSKVHIRPFIDFHQIDMSESLLPIEDFPNFNEFFYRALKPGSRPIFEQENPSIAISAADCRLTVFTEVSEATRLWIKGKNFSLKGLLGSEELAQKFEGGSLGIFRLAPQDYHRYHVPVGGRFESMTLIDGEYYTVSPMAVRGNVDVFTMNKRTVIILDSPEFGKVAFVAIGATLVGSIVITKTVGDELKKGDEIGYFAFGGSTIVVLFEKGKINFDKDIVENSQKPLETLIKMGESLGTLV